MRYTVFMRRLLSVLLVVIFITPLLARAQLSALGIHLLTISVESGEVSPHADISVRLRNNGGDDLSQNLIRWSTNGTTIAAGVGLTKTQITLGGLGVPTSLTATIISPSGAILDSESITLTPAVVDLLWDADTYAHPFFLGKTLPFPGAVVRAEARPVFIQNKTQIENADLYFEWRMNGVLLSDESGMGKNTLSIPSPALFSTGYLSVLVSSKDGSQAKATVRIPTKDPYLVLYRIDPLLGIDFYNALGKNNVVNDSEETFTMVPYAAPTHLLRDSRLLIEWLVNGVPVQTHSNDPFTISLISPAPNTVAHIEATVRHVSNYLLSSSGSWRSRFSQEGSPSGTLINPFNEVQ